MPTRDDGVDSVRYFTNISNSFADLNEFLKNTGVGSSDLANAISDFMSRLNMEYFEEEPIESVSFDEVMGFNTEGI